MAQSAKCLPHKREDSSSGYDLGVACTSVTPTLRVWTKMDPRVSVVSQSSQIDGLQVQQEALLE